jgi:hypothetical protein
MPKKTSPPVSQSASAKRVEPSEESSQHIWLAGLGDGQSPIARHQGL